MSAEPAPATDATATPIAGSPPDLWNLGDDDAITGPEQDAFGRAPFARHLAGVIRTAPEAASFRIGLFGEWGEGKTSVMALMEHELGAADFVCVRVSAWDVRDANDVVRRVAAALAATAGTDASTAARARALVGRAGAKLGELRKVAAEVHWSAKGLNAVTGEALERTGEQVATWSAYAALKDARGALGSCRAVVFVDDLDRADPGGLPRVLMALREAVPIEGLVFVLALSTRAVESALERSGAGLETAARFLEKIVEYPAYLPTLSAAVSERYAARCITGIEGLRHPDVLRDLAHHLPTNPRRLKRFLRLLAANRATFARFDDDEIDWRSLYACQLLLAEFPEQTRQFREEPQALRAMTSHAMDVYIHQRNARSNVPAPRPPEERFAPEKDPGRSQFLELFRLVREGHTLVSYSLADLLFLTDAPPALTAREVYGALDALVEHENVVESDAAWSQVVDKLTTGPDVSGEAERAERARTVWRCVVDRLQGATRAAWRASTPAERHASTVVRISDERDHRFRSKPIPRFARSRSGISLKPITAGRS